MKEFFIFLFLITNFQVNAILHEEEEQLEQNPSQVLSTEVPEVPSDLKGLVWNKWDTDNFIILSIDEQQGIFLKDNIEEIKKEVLDKWGIKNFNFSNKCKIVCTTNKKLLDRIFRISESKHEIRRDQNGAIQMSAIWFTLEDDQMPISDIANVCLEHANLDIPYYCVKGMSVLSDSSNFKKNMLMQNFSEINKDLIYKTMEESSEIESFDLKSAVICLMLRKEFGKDNFIQFLKTNDYNCFGYNSDLENFEEILNKYYNYLLEDMTNNEVPDEYLDIK
jgi:hypothetical protein